MNIIMFPMLLAQSPFLEPWLWEAVVYVPGCMSYHLIITSACPGSIQVKGAQRATLVGSCVSSPMGKKMFPVSRMQTGFPKPTMQEPGEMQD